MQKEEPSQKTRYALSAQPNGGIIPKKGVWLDVWLVVWRAVWQRALCSPKSRRRKTAPNKRAPQATESSKMTQDFALSDLSKSRLKKGNIASVVCFLLTLLLAGVVNSNWIAAASLYFVAKFVYRSMLIRRANPHVVVSDDGISLRWFKARDVAWSNVAAIDASDDDAIIVKVTEGEDLRILKRRIEGGAVALAKLLQAKAPTGV